MISNNDTKYMPDASPVIAPTAGSAYPTKLSPPLDVRTTVTDPPGPDPTTNLSLYYDVPSNTPTPVTTNTLVEPTE